MEKYLACNVTRRLEKYPKEVIIKAFLRRVGFNADRILAECEEIQKDILFKKHMAYAEELDKKTEILIASKPQKGDWESYTVWLDKLKEMHKEQDKIQIKIDKHFARK